MTTPEQRAKHAAYMREWNARNREREVAGLPRPTPPTLEQRFWPKVDKSAGPDGCWLWTAGGTGPAGERYGEIKWNGRDRMAHRVAYELVVGPIPAGLQIDHLCRVRLCVNPAHLEPVTQRENILRGNSYMAQAARRTHCPHGHSEWRVRRGRRECVPCAKAGKRASFLRSVAKRAVAQVAVA